MRTKLEELIDVYFSGTGVSVPKVKNFALELLRRAINTCDIFAFEFETTQSQELIAKEFGIDVRDLQ